MAENKHFYSVLDRPKTEVSPSGKKVYEWDYLDKVGNLKHDKKNIYEMVQSFKDSTDYKKLIKQGDIDELGINHNDVFMDLSGCQNDLAGYCGIITNIANNLEQMRETDTGTKETSEIGKVSKQSAEVGTKSQPVGEQPTIEQAGGSK